MFDEILNEELLPLDVWKIKLEELKNLNDRLPKKEFEKRLLGSVQKSVSAPCSS